MEGEEDEEESLQVPISAPVRKLIYVRDLV